MTFMKISNESGMNRPAMVFLLAIFGSAAYAANAIFPFYYHYYELLATLQAQARVAEEYNDIKIREAIDAKIKELNIPIKSQQDFQLRRSGKFIYLNVTYTEEFWVTFKEKDYKVWEFPFVAEVEQEY